MFRLLSRVLKRSFFEGARRTKVNRDFQNASNLDFETLALTDRDTMRARARWLKANNPIMSNIDSTIINNVIGPGIKLQTDQEVETAWLAWCEECDLTGRLKFEDMQAVILDTRMVDGEILVYKKPTKDGLRLQLIEADQIDSYRGKGGLEVDDNGVVTAYFIKSGSKTERVPAEYIINYRKTGRATQYRGVSEYSRSIIDIKNFSAFVSANIETLRARANVAYAVTSASGGGIHGGVMTDDDGERIQQINGAFVHYLGAGESITALDSRTTPVNFREFVNSTVRMIAVGRNISYELAFRDFSQVNFSSARASIIQDNKRFDAEQKHIIQYVLNDIFRTWYEIETLRGALRGPMPKFGWVTPAREWVQPKQDLDVVLTKIENNLMAPEDAAKALGQDYEDILKRKKANLDLAKKILGDDYATAQTRMIDEEEIAHRVAEHLNTKDDNA